MAVQHICGSMAYRLAYQKKIVQKPVSGTNSETLVDSSPKYFNTNRYYCENCDVILKVVEEY